MGSVKPKKKLGQHFLTDHRIAEHIVAALSYNKSGQIVEVGPGTGVLTRLLLNEWHDRLLAVEVDTESVNYLKKMYPHLHLIEQDFLHLDLYSVVKGSFSVIGNFPYNISSQIFFRLLDYRHEVNEIVCMIQKEVAVRLASPPGSKDYGILSVLLQAWFEIDYLFTVKPGAFHPPPKVNSSVIRLRRNQRKHLNCNEKLFKQIVKASFNQRRKVIRNSLKSYLLPLGNQAPYTNQRPEQLSVNQFVELTNYIASKQTGDGYDAI